MRNVRQPWMSLTLARWICLGAGLAAGLPGCAQEKRIEGYTGPVLAAPDLELNEGTCPANEYRFADDERSVGRFPTALAVARVEPAAGADSHLKWQVHTLKEEQATYWNRLFDTTPAVREVVVLKATTSFSQGEGVRRVSSSARRLNAGLCLLYGPAHAQADEAALMGHLVDTQTGRTLACIQAVATPADFEAVRSDRPDGDERHRDVQYLAARKFEGLVRQCVIELMHRDEPPTTTRPSPWQGMPLHEQPTIYVIPESLSTYP